MTDSVIQYSIIGLYFALILIKGLRHSKDINTSDDFLVAGRNIGWFTLLCTMGATIVGGGYSIGAIGKTYELGIAMVIISAGGYLQLVFSGLFVAPKFREANLYTVAGYFGHRFDERSRFLSFILSLIFSIGVLGAQMVAFGKIITTMIPELPYFWGVAIGAILVITYSTAGGLLAVIKTDFYQFLILIAGFTLTVILCIPELSSQPEPLTKLIPSDFFTLEGGKGWGFMISMFFAFLLGETFAPGYATRFCVGKDIHQTKKGIAGSGFFLMLFFPAVIFLIALYARLSFPNIDPEMALPSTIIRLNNPIVGGIIIAALMSAVMSSADSILNSATAIFTKDLWEHYLVKRTSDRTEGLRIARWSSILLGLAGLVLALVIPDVIDLLLLTYNLWAPGIILPVIVGVFTKLRSKRQNILIFGTMVSSMVATILFMLTPYAEDFQASVFGVAASIVIYGMLYVALPKASHNQP
ncbi:MAG: sodium:solute symporter family protein [Ignavibacteriae bacterium]|nr:sodium:solute symporter family protein [Ignavibacteriota bacterium]MCB9216788.1 sodium:solute symporter family protein [Ignavibacteria bacterium]